jgi:hypothetical protein
VCAHIEAALERANEILGQCGVRSSQEASHSNLQTPEKLQVPG